MNKEVVRRMDIHYSKQAVKFLSRQDATIRARIVSAIMFLPASDVKKLTGQPYYRLRVGDYRVIFTRNGNIIEVAKIDNRGQVYKM